MEKLASDGFYSVNSDYMQGLQSFCQGVLSDAIKLLP